MDAGFADHIVDEGHFVNKVAEGFYDVAEMFAALSVLSEAEGGFHPWSESILERFDGFAEVGCLPVMFFQLGFVVPEIHVTGGTSHKQLNDAFCFWGKVQSLECGPRAHSVRARLVQGACGLIFEQHDSGSERSKLLPGAQNLSSRWNSEMLEHRNDSGLHVVTEVTNSMPGNEVSAGTESSCDQRRYFAVPEDILSNFTRHLKMSLRKSECTTVTTAADGAWLLREIGAMAERNNCRFAFRDDSFRNEIPDRRLNDMLRSGKLNAEKSQYGCLVKGTC